MLTSATVRQSAPVSVLFPLRTYDEILIQSWVQAECTARDNQQTYHPRIYKGTSSFAWAVHFAAERLVPQGFGHIEVQNQPHLLSPGPNGVRVVFTHGKRRGDEIHLHQKGDMTLQSVEANANRPNLFSRVGIDLPEVRNPRTLWVVSELNSQDVLSIHLAWPISANSKLTKFLCGEIETIHCELLPTTTSSQGPEAVRVEFDVPPRFGT